MKSKKTPDTAELKEMIRNMARADAVASEDDFESLEDSEELDDIADDAWNHSAIPALEWKFSDDPKSGYARLGAEFIHQQVEKLSLSTLYIKEFAAAAIKHFKLRF